MKFAAKSLLFLMSLAATFAYAQTLPHFQHIIIVVQKNRTPDNLFGSGPSGTTCGTEDPLELGVDIENGGRLKGQLQPQCLAALPLSSWDATLNNGNGMIVDPGHYYSDWGTDYDKGGMDGFCHRFGSTCPEYSYVLKSDVQPYFDIATNYGFANYFFQTNEGPSYPAHQFLFTGTSAPVEPHDKNNYYLDFVGGTNPNFNESGCANNNNDIPTWVLPDGTQDFDPPTSVECYPHDSLVTNSNGDKIASWAYYTVPPRNVIWDAPAAIPEVCYGENDLDDLGQACGPTGRKF
jgi:hypothetical protein